MHIPFHLKSKALSAALAAACLVCGLMTVRPVLAGDASGDWSIDFKGGVTSGQFTFDSRMTGHGGLQLRYSMNPVISLYGSFGVGVFRDDKSMMEITGFSNDYFVGGIGARVNVLHMLAGSSSVSERLAVYTTTGIQMMRVDVRVRNRELQGYVGNNFSGNAMVLNLGAGASFRINRRVDLFLQTELNHSDSDLLDGYERLPGSSRTGFISGGDSFINTSAGITVKLGGSDVRHTDWRHREWDARAGSRPASSVEQELARMQEQLERSDRIKEELARRLQSLTANLTEFSELINTTQQQQLDTQDLKLEQMQRQMDQLQAEIGQIAGRVAPDAPSPQTPAVTTPPEADPDQPRHYIVAGAFRNRDNAARLLQQITEEGFGQAALVTDAGRGFHIVTYVSYPTREQAEQELARIRSRANPDAWIFTQ